LNLNLNKERMLVTYSNFYFHSGFRITVGRGGRNNQIPVFLNILSLAKHRTAQNIICRPIQFIKYYIHKSVENQSSIKTSIVTEK
jgi:hypothetical protein